MGTKNNQWPTKFGHNSSDAAGDRRTWFKRFPWEDRMQTAHEQGTLVLLQNLDPAYTSAQVEVIVWHGIKESCTAKMIQRTANSSPHYALVILKTREAAQKIVRELDEGCLLLSNGRFVQKEAISTSHCSQPNIIEYDMTMEWCLQQEGSDLFRKNLYKQQGKELRQLKAKLKRKDALKAK
ncbi:hypothetical protein ACFX2F_043563 [Malus domestica]